MYDKKLKYKILSIFAATVMTFTAITPVWAEEENLEADASGETSSDTSEKNAAPEIAGLTYESAMDRSEQQLVCQQWAKFHSPIHSQLLPPDEFATRLPCPLLMQD